MVANPANNKDGQDVTSYEQHSMLKRTDLEEAYLEFRREVSELSRKFATPQTTIIKYMIDNTCECRARHEIELPSYRSEQKFDKYFSIKHEFIKNKLVQKLSTTLRDKGIPIYIATEKKSAAGVYDILIANNDYMLTISDVKNGKRICVELKSGESFSLTQIERYLWEADVVILVRVIMKQAVRIARSDIESYLIHSLLDLKKRAEVVSLDDKESKNVLRKIPGSYCKGCPVATCEFNKAAEQVHKVVSFGNESMQKDILAVFQNIDECVDSAIDIIIKELLENNAIPRGRNTADATAP